MKILLTGYSGYIGSYFLNYLSKNKLYDIYLLGRKKNKKYQYEYWDLDKRNISNKFFLNTEMLFHFAAIAHTTNKKKQYFYKKLMSQNYEATIYLANLSIKFNLKKFIFISSTKSLDDEFKNLNIDQLKVLNTKNNYGKIKRITELMLENIFIKSKTKLFIIRPALVYGPNVKGNLYFLKIYISKSPCIILPYIKNTRTLIHIDNLVESIYFVVIKKNLDLVCYTFCDNDFYSFFEIVNAINIIINKKIIYIRIPNYFLKLILYFNLKFKIKFIKQIFGDEIYRKTDIKKHGYKQVMKIENFNDTNI